MKDKKDLWDGEHYKKNSSPQQATAEKILAGIEFTKDNKILDIGCGDGKITSAVSSEIPNGKVIGIDPSKSMILHAQKNFGSKDNLNFIEAGAENFKINEIFDYIFSFYSLHWIKDKVSVFKNIEKHLAENGQFIFVTSGRENKSISEVFSSEKWESQIAGHGKRFHSSDESKIEEMLNKAGFSNIDIKVEQWSKLYDTKDELLNWILSWVPFATGLDEKNSLEFSQQIIDNLEKAGRKRGVKDKIELLTEMLIIKAEK